MRTDEQRAKTREAMHRWRQANPERNRETAKRAMAVYLATPQGRATANAAGRRSYALRYVAHPRVLVRGLLCNDCNSGIGRLGDSVEIVAAALAYLQKGLAA